MVSNFYKKNKISIIIPSFNQGKYLEKSILSVINQKYENVELIIMDGGSTDDSVEIIKKYESYLYFWKSGKDNGQSSAINEGFNIATGKFKTWLNSDDILLPGSLSLLNTNINKFPDCRWFLGNLIWIDKNDSVLKVGKAKKYDRYFVNKGLFTSGGPSSFMREDLFREYGFLREDFHYMMDTEMWYRLAYHQESFVRLEKYIWALRIHEEAKQSGHNFNNSVLADKSHPSWKQKRYENKLMNELYDFNIKFYDSTLNRISKVLNSTFYTRIIDRLYIGKSYLEMFNR